MLVYLFSSNLSNPSTGGGISSDLGLALWICCVECDFTLSSLMEHTAGHSLSLPCLDWKVPREFLLHMSELIPPPVLGLVWVSVLHFCLWVCESACESVSNHFSPHPPPYIELSFSSSLCWYIYSPQTTQIQALEEGSARTCVGATP